MKKLKDVFFKTKSTKIEEQKPSDGNQQELTKKEGFNDYVASVILLIIAVVIGLNFKTQLIAEFNTIFTWWGTNMDTLTSTK